VQPAVMEMIAAVIHSARARGLAIRICGQVPGDYPEAERPRRCETAGALEA